MGRSTGLPQGASSDRSIRSLALLQSGASSARTLNLLVCWRKDGETAAYKSAPFFKNPQLNRSIIVKHRLRRDELDLFYDGRGSATKVILPIDVLDLRSGARSFFIGQSDYRKILAELSGPRGDLGDDDRQLLECLNALPSLDPFLMRERLRKSGFSPARCYFDISEADTARMFDFVKREVAPLIGLSGNMDAQINEKTAKLAFKILNNDGDAELEPLREGMGMDRLSFEEGMFCWKGFIYYKWSLLDLAPLVRPVSQDIASVKPVGPMTSEERAYIIAARARLSRAIAEACETVRLTLKVYDDAYADLTRNGQPNAFKSFLLKAPGLFHELGERLGAVQHIVSFWRYRFPMGKRSKIPADELYDLLADFELSLSFEAESAIDTAA